jgi:serine/threonine protein kinase
LKKDQLSVTLDDGCLIVVNSMSFSESVENREIAKEIEKKVNVLHPCISVPIGFVLPAESSELRELKIVRLFVEGCSLAEVILTNPVWWTPKMKAKVIAGIALGLRFVHSFGLIHGNLNSNNILLDETHRIEMIGFGWMDLKVQEGECGRESGVGELFDEEWTAQADIRAFGSLLVEITVGQPSILAGDADSEGIVKLGVSKLVSEIIERIQSKNWKGVTSLNSIIDILKENEFQIEAGVDSEEVLEFVRCVEFMEQSSE